MSVLRVFEEANIRHPSSVIGHHTETVYYNCPRKLRLLTPHTATASCKLSNLSPTQRHRHTSRSAQAPGQF
jgi:hypothetical protein